MNPQDYFYFTKSERNGIIVLIAVIAVIIAYPYINDYFREPSLYDYSGFKSKVEEYNRVLAEYHAARDEFRKNREAEALRTTRVPLALKMQNFNPNDADEEDFTEMGFPNRLISNILNYRKAGGTFKYREDFKRIYGVSDDFYKMVYDFIELPVKAESIPIATAKVSPSRTGFHRSEILLELNKSDTIEMQQISGIGSAFSRRITRYRDMLGGYYSIEQLREVYGMDSTRFEQIREKFFIDSLDLKKLYINTDDFATLVKHPYLNRNQVNSILQMRQQHGPYKTIEEIKRSVLISEEDFRKLAPYLSAE
jgi:competence protein ComEA